MRIGYEVTSLCSSPTGVGNYTASLLRSLYDLCDDEIVQLSHRLPQHLVAEGCEPKMHPTMARSALRYAPVLANKTIWMQLVLPLLIPQLGLDLCHFTNGVAPLATSCPSVVTIHDMTLWLYPQYHYWKRQASVRPFGALAARRAKAIIANSKCTKRDIQRVLGISPEKIHVVYLAAAPTFKTINQPSILESLRRRYRLPEHIILSVGTIEPRKNLVRLLEAFAQLRLMFGSCYGFVIVGGRGWKDEPVFAAIERLGLGQAVHILDYIPSEDLAAIYNIADVLAFPSLYEGFGLPLVEAMACGTPIVTSRRGSLGEIARDAAEYVEPEDVTDIIEGLRHVLVDCEWKLELRARGLERASMFSWTTAAEKTLSIYRTVAR